MMHAPFLGMYQCVCYRALMPLSNDVQHSHAGLSHQCCVCVMHTYVAKTYPRVYAATHEAKMHYAMIRNDEKKTCKRTTRIRNLVRIPMKHQVTKDRPRKSNGQGWSNKPFLFPHNRL